MLRADGDGLCLECHEPGAADPRQRARLGMSSAANPADIATQMMKAASHRRSSCRDCHSAHGASSRPGGPVDAFDLGTLKPSPRRGFTFEADLCLSCHGSRGAAGGDPHDLGALLDPRNLSYHPVLATGRALDVPSLVAPLTVDSRTNCTDCHTNDEPGGPRGPHGSSAPGLLGATLAREDGQPESETAYALCYACHDREVILGGDAFRAHAEHVVDERTACGSCHDPHGATSARALLRFNEPTVLRGVTPSSSGRLEFVDLGPGSGACFLRCHGENHDPLGYGPGFDEGGRPLIPEMFGPGPLPTSPTTPQRPAATVTSLD